MKSSRIALTGGIATGKSTVAKLFADLGAVILDADEFARQAVQPGTAGWTALRNFLGESYFGTDGQLKRAKLRQCIVQDDECRDRVNSILHPFITESMEAEWLRLSQSSEQYLPIFDIPLLFEAGAAHRFDTIILVYAPPEVQVQRLMERDEVSRRQAEHTLGMQMPIDAKRSKAHFVIDNSSDIHSTKRQVTDIWEKLQTARVP